MNHMAPDVSGAACHQHCHDLRSRCMSDVSLSEQGEDPVMSRRTRLAGPLDDRSYPTAAVATSPACASIASARLAADQALAYLDAGAPAIAARKESG